MKGYVIRGIACLMMLWSGSVFGQAEGEKLVFRNLDESLGLSNSNILSMLRDADGMMWYGTAYGLYRYDGTRTKIFLNTKDSTSISHNNILKIYLGPNDNLWVKNVNGIFDIYDPITERFSRGVTVYSLIYHLASDSVGMLMKDRQNRFWFTHPAKGISIYDGDTGKTIYVQKNNEKGSLFSNNIASIAEAPDGLVWVVHSSGTIDLLDPNRLIVTKTLRLPDSDIPTIAGYEIMIDSDGDAWIFDPERDLGVFRVDGFTHEVYTNKEDKGRFRLNNNMVKAIVEAKKGQIWLGTDHGGINVLDKTTRTVKYLTGENAQDNSMPHNVIYSLYKDDEDIIWVGTHKKGVAYYHQGLLRFSHVRKNFADPNSLPFNDVNTFVEDSLGNLYIGTNGGGLFYHNRKTNTYKQFRHTPESKNSLTGDVIVDLMIDHKGILWIATYLNGLGSYDGKEFKNYNYLPDNHSGIPGPSIWKLFEDSTGKIWIGTLRSGISMLDKDRKTFHNYPAGSPPFYTNNQYITGFAEDKLGNIWVSGGSGLNMLNYETGRFAFYSENQESGLLDSNITDLFVDAEGVLWTTTMSGLYYFNTSDSSFVHYGEAEGLPTAYLVDLVEDDGGNLWISSQMGLSYAEIDRSVNPYAITFQNFDQKDGLQAALFNKNAALKTSRNEFIFGGPNGYNIFKSENFAFERNNPKVVFTDFQLFNEEVKVGEKLGNRVLLPKSLENMDKLVLKHDENIFSIGFSALNFLYPEKNKFRYKLIGFNDDWIYLNDDLAKVTFTNLDPGNYTLVVQPGTVLDGWSMYEYKLDIKILAPFWKTPIAYFLYFLSILAIIFYFRHQLLTRQREKFDREQAMREAKRVQDLDRLKTKFFTNLSHEFRTPLSLILTPTEHLISETENTALLSQYRIIQRNARRLLKLINQLLDVKNVENGGLAFHPSEGDVIQFIKECVADFHELSENKHIHLNFEANIHAQQAIFDPDKLEKIIFNLLSNAFKFTQEDGAITVALELQQENEEKGILILSVSDTGVGISTEDQHKIFERFYTTEGHRQQLNQGSGIGLSLVQDFARTMNGEITVESEPGMGSVFTVTIPLALIISENWEEDEEVMPKGGELKELILIAEDHAEFRNYLKDCLSDSYQVLTATNGAQGWDLAQQHIPDLIVSDLMMPQMDGKEFCQKVKGDIKTSHIPVILLTAKKSEEAMVQSLDSRCNLYLTKPFNLEVLQLSIKNLLRERNMIQEQNRNKIQINASEVNVTSLDDQLIQKAVALVEKHMEDPQLSVEFLSKELGMSRVHLYKKLQSITGKSPIEFIRLIRLKRASQLLAKSQLNISEIAYMVGYNNAKYFAKHFKAEFSVLPSEYAARQQELAAE
ncbi:signal transduction histidine kinase/ligand-binding sensor domain-containing protein/DNA-binding response OmpR family regulator [Algoriphagus sp. 4150]|uniref:hybrid sensor histidine kinase/response regulator transcription factor n=1 Tax=Algoriphagus sp. 4150 TaxID=2817756 RepID=UPI00285D7EAF|nr:two-component regulator propeller domain-containing protein [Algoriphagus sp. 4150]MDR7130157.1 signal transduction histidine kinase/ligand-binding sensor domain-containing protein/DNA-binding response OmpR family regulator [Algoriphagus sp. 4150]